ncbi:MAG: hypothetical protein CFE24_09685 [Flavobacterium sp. BFFFF2]|nr:MAG: hypothetical protein CFE24_09685 [Flavobacterium sp. BFFFF2]
MKTLIQKINTLPLIKKKAVGDFVDSLLVENLAKNTVAKKLRSCGVFKNKIKISPDFDEPLDDFNMYQ